MSDRLMTVEEMAKYLQVDQYTIYAWVRKGKMPAFKVGRFWRFRKEEIDKWLAGLEPATRGLGNL